MNYALLLWLHRFASMLLLFLGLPYLIRCPCANKSMLKRKRARNSFLHARLPHGKEEISI